MLRAAHPEPRDPEVSLYGPIFKVGGLQFTVPSKWVVEPTTSDARAGQWHIPLPRGQEGEGGEVVVYYFGQGIGGSARENIDAWAATMSKSEDRTATPDLKNRVANGFKVSQVTIFGTYNQPVPLSGVPPQPKPDYGFFGAVVENSAGNIYWRITGPETLVTANLPLFNKIIDSVKPEAK